MKKRSLLFLIITFIISFGLYQVYVFYFDNNDNIQSIYLVPKDAVYIIESQKPINNWDDISKSDIWKHLNTNTYFNTLAKNLNKLDTIFKQKQGVFNRIGNREILISAHVYAPKQYGFLYVVDLQKIAKLNVVKNNLNTVINTNYKVSKRQYNEHEITEIYDLKNHETLYISFIKNQMIASYSHTLVEASIDQYSNPEIGRNLNFIEVKKHVGYNDMFRLYFQYDYLDEFVNVFSDTPGDLTKTLSKSLEFSGFSFDLEKNAIVANGITNTNNQASTYLKALQKSGQGKRTIKNIVPKNTAIYLSFGFKSFEDFYSNFETIQKENPEQFKSYVEGTSQIESFLKINLKTHFMSWIDDEIALIQLHSNVSDSKKDVALILKTKAIDDAKDNLDFILEQIRKRTPVKFKEVNYKGYAINFMSIKGFFKILLGDLFSNIEKPYFTIIEDYIIFSNEPNTLKSIINAYTNKETLNYFKPFNDFDNRFDNKSSVFAYINTPNLYNTAYDFVDIATKKQLKTNKDYFICFPQIGIQLTPSKNDFKSQVILEYQTPDKVKSSYTFDDAKPKTVITTPTSLTEENINKDTVFNIPELYPSDLTAKLFTKKYSNGNTKFSVELKDGLKHGSYEAYYQNGNLKISGKYRKDKQVGTWKAYDINENLIFKTRF
jgi:antitoxin component YwqK of YwqJK toxin-antitoxin module